MSFEDLDFTINGVESFIDLRRYRTPFELKKQRGEWFNHINFQTIVTSLVNQDISWLEDEKKNLRTIHLEKPVSENSDPKTVTLSCCLKTKINSLIELWAEKRGVKVTSIEWSGTLDEEKEQIDILFAFTLNTQDQTQLFVDYTNINFFNVCES